VTKEIHKKLYQILGHNNDEFFLTILSDVNIIEYIIDDMYDNKRCLNSITIMFLLSYYKNIELKYFVKLIQCINNVFKSTINHTNTIEQQRKINERVTQLVKSFANIIAQ